MEIFLGNPRKVICNRATVQQFKAVWPCSNLRDRAYWFEFDSKGDLVDCDVPEHDDGEGASALADDCREFLESGNWPEWYKGS